MVLPQALYMQTFKTELYKTNVVLKTQVAKISRFAQAKGAFTASEITHFI